ncbi:restriction endonuclease subunit S [Sharpea azabuensis]|uniref:restriction endonuclease subunit S n=1 Tax=Sharpea azabuensis TaxID=322505 RepID=UPI00156B9F32|nr:restriction endonuclease subunit S [Sharpea azabuensis]
MKLVLNFFFIFGNSVSLGTHGTHADVDDGPLLLSAKNIKNGGIYWDETDRRISYGEYEKIHSNFSLESGDVLLTIVGSIGETAILKDSEGITFQRSVAFLRPNNKITPDFLYSEIQTPIFQKELDSRKSTSAQPGIYLGDLAEIPLIFSTKIDEQKKIGEYFSNLDNLITLHQYKLYMGVYRKGTILTYFWEQRKVGELLSERIEQFPKSDEYPLMAFVANEGVAPKGDRYDRSALVNDTEGKLYKRTEFGDFIYSSNNLETGSIGLNKYGNATISSVYSIFRPTGIADSDFIGRRFIRKDFINEMVKWRQGVIYGQWKIHEEDFLKIEVMVPSLEEQRLIGSFLDNLDHLITLHQRKIKYILKEVFIWIILIKRVVLKKPLSPNYRIMVGRRKLLSILQNRI